MERRDMLRPVVTETEGTPRARRAGGPAPDHAAPLFQIALPRERKSFVRAPRDRTQRWRLGFQLAFLVLNVVPVYGFAVMIDAVFANSVEFWTGDNPVTAAGDTERRVVNAAGGEVVTMTRLAPGVMDVDMRAPDGTHTQLTVVLELDSVAAYGRDGTLLARVGDREGIPSLLSGGPVTR